jgi:uncharacterized membrane protein YfcA
MDAAKKMSDLVLFSEVSLVMFVAATFRTAFGFGEALIAVPMLSLVLPVKLSAPLAVLASILIAAVAVYREWRHIHFKSAKNLLIATAFGIPFGLFLLYFGEEWLVKGILGVFLLAFSVFSIVRPGAFVLKDERHVWLFGFFAGVAGGSYGMNGPPLAIYGAGRRWAPERFRATIQAYFLPASLLGMAGYFFAGYWTAEVNVIFFYSLPAVALGILAGTLLGRIADKQRFARLLYGWLALLACGLLAQAAAGLR